MSNAGIFVDWDVQVSEDGQSATISMLPFRVHEGVTGLSHTAMWQPKVYDSVSLEPAGLDAYVVRPSKDFGLYFARTAEQDLECGSVGQDSRNATLQCEELVCPKHRLADWSRQAC